MVMPREMVERNQPLQKDCCSWKPSGLLDAMEKRELVRPSGRIERQSDSRGMRESLDES